MSRTEKPNPKDKTVTVSLVERPKDKAVAQDKDRHRRPDNRPKQETAVKKNKDEKNVAKKSDKEPAQPATAIEADTSDSSSYYYSYESPELLGPEPSKPAAVKAVPAKAALQAAKPKAAPAAPSSSSAGPRAAAELELVGSVLSSQAEMMRFWMMQHRQGQE